MSVELIKLYVAIYKKRGDIGLLCPTKLTPAFRLQLTKWSMENDTTPGLIKKNSGVKKETMKSNKNLFQSMNLQS